MQCIKLCLILTFLGLEALHYNKHCQDHAYGEYDTLNDAIDACNNDIACNFVYDPQCDGVSPFKICPDETTLLDSTTSCVYEFYKHKGNCST